MNNRNITGLFFVAISGLTACATLLGDDFEMTTESAGGSTPATSSTAAQGGSGDGGSSSTSSQGGAGGSTAVGGQGGTEPAPFTCNWEFAEHVLVDSLEGASNASWAGEPQLLRLGSSIARAVIRRYDEGFAGMQIFTVGPSLAHTTTVEAHDVYNMVRTSVFGIGILYATEDSSTSNYDPTLMLAHVSDTNIDLTSGVYSSELVLPDGFKNIDTNSYSLEARMVARQTTATSYGIDLVVAYPRNPDPTMMTSNTEYIEAYGRWDATVSDPVTTSAITPPGTSLGSNDAQPTMLFHHDGKSYAFFGTPTAALGTRQYVLDESVTGPVVPNSLPPSDIALAIGNYSTSGTTMVGWRFGTPFEFFIGKVDNEKLGDIDIATDLSVFLSLTSLADLDIQGGAALLGDIFTIAGGTIIAPTDMAYRFYDAEARERGEGTLPFTAQIAAGIERKEIDDVAMAADSDDFGTNGGLVHVLWTEDHLSPSSSSEYQVMYYDQLNCKLETE